MRDWEMLSPKEQALHPNTPIDRLRYLTHFHPAEVLQNPVLPLLFLEDAASAHELLLMAQTNAAIHQIEVLLPTTDENTRRLWLCDCAERILPFYEAQNPGEHGPSEALRAAREYAAGRATLSALSTAQVELIEAQRPKQPPRRQGVVYGAPPPIYVPTSDDISRGFLSALRHIMGRQISSPGAFAIAESLVDLALLIARTREPLDLTRPPYQDRKNDDAPTKSTERQWQASRLAELLG